MSDLPSIPSSRPRPAGGGGDRGNQILRGDTLLALGLIAILTFMLIPIPTFLLDIGLSISILFSIFILMLVLSINKPLEFSTFPTVLLITTALRLGLNVATTRLILSEGHNGHDAAGHVIQAFGGLIIQGNYVVGGIVFAILVIVNFVVITKGSGRIAEVAARFTLDAMPGKQMAMDGASKFVRGDAVAGLLIVFINIIGGIIIGTVQQGLSLAEAAETYTLLTIGDGLVSQIPALIISIGAGLLVSKAGVEGAADQALLDQFSRHPRAMAFSAALMMVIAITPGIPFGPFAFLGATFGGLAYMSWKRQEVERVAKAAPPVGKDGKPALPGARPAEEPISKALAMDIIRLELGYGLLPLVQGEGGNKVTDQIKGLRRQLAEDMGYVLPAVRIQDNLQLPANTYYVRIKEIEAGRGEVRPGMLMCMDPTGAPITLPGESTVEPTFGLPAMWIDEQYREEAHFKGYTVVDAPTVITTHITEIIKENMSDLLSYAETQKLLDELPKEYQKLVADVIPGQVSIGGLQRVLQSLVSERVSVRDLPTILEGIAEATAYTKNIAFITEHVRSRLARQICDQNTNSSGFVPLVTLSPEWEQAFGEALIGDGEERQLAMAPTRLQEFISAVRDTYEKVGLSGETPVLLTSPVVRPYVRSVIERFRPQTTVMSQNEIHPRAKIKTLGSV